MMLVLARPIELKRQIVEASRPLEIPVSTLSQHYRVSTKIADATAL